MTQRRTAAAATAQSPAATTTTSSYYHQNDNNSYATSTPYMATASPAPLYSSYTPASPAQPSYATSSTLSTPANIIEASSTSSNNVSLAFLIPPLLAMLYTFQETATLLLPVLLCCCLILYSLDLANLRNASFTANWVAVVALAVTNAYDVFRNNASNGILGPTLEALVESLFFACWVRGEIMYNLYLVVPMRAYTHPSPLS